MYVLALPNIKGNNLHMQPIFEFTKINKPVNQLTIYLHCTTKLTLWDTGTELVMGELKWLNASTTTEALASLEPAC